MAVCPPANTLPIYHRRDVYTRCGVTFICAYRKTRARYHAIIPQLRGAACFSAMHRQGRLACDSSTIHLACLYHMYVWPRLFLFIHRYEIDGWMDGWILLISVGHTVFQFLPWCHNWGLSKPTIVFETELFESF